MRGAADKAPVAIAAVPLLFASVCLIRGGPATTPLVLASLMEANTPFAVALGVPALLVLIL